MKEVIEFSPESDHRARQSFYIEPDRSRLRPNAVFLLNGKTWFETNSYGLKGEDPTPGKRLIVVWGDSVVFGAGRGWPAVVGDLVDAWHVLNGGMEGDTLGNILRRAAALNRELRVDVNVVFPGWHPSAKSMSVNTSVAEELHAHLDQVPNAVLSTIPSPLNRDVIASDHVVDLLRTECPHGIFRIWGTIETDDEVRLLYDRLLERNEIVRRVASERGIPLIEWAEAMDSTKLDDFRADFFDFGHPRPSSYEKIAAIWAELLKARMPDIR